MREEKRISVGKIIVVSATVAVTVAAAAFVLYRLFRKYFKITFDCGDCDTCGDDCFCDDFDMESDEDYIPECDLADEDEDDAE